MKKITAITLAFTVFSSVITAQASSVELSAQTGESPNQFYTLRVYDIGKAIGSDDAGDIVRFEQNRSDADGKIEFCFEFGMKSGIYPYIIQSETGKWQKTGQIAFTNEEEFTLAMQELVAALKAENPGAAVKDVFEKYISVFNIEDKFSINADILKLDTSKAYARIAARLSEDAVLDDVQRIYMESMLLCALEKGSNELIKSVDEGYAEFLGVTDATIIEKYKSLPDDSYRLSVAAMEKGVYSETAEYVKAHTIAVAVASMNACSTWQELDSEITALNGIADLGFPAVSGSARSTVLQKLISKKPFASKADFAGKVSAAVSEANSQSSSSVIKNTGGGGSGSSNVSYKTTHNPSSGGQQNDDQAQGFTDIDSVEWARASIEYLVSIGAVSGRSKTEFAPMESITREEFVKILVSAMNISAPSDVQFDDFAENAWYKPYVAAAVNSGIVVGIGDNIFGVGMNITRQDAAVMLMRALEHKGITLSEASHTGFADAEEISDYAVSAVAALSDAKVINGTPEGNFLPLAPITRAEAARLIHGVMVLIQ